MSSITTRYISQLNVKRYLDIATEFHQKAIHKDATIYCKDGFVGVNSTFACFASCQLKRVFITNKAKTFTIQERAITTKSIEQVIEMLHLGEVYVADNDIADFNQTILYLRMGYKCQRMDTGRIELKICEESIQNYFKFLRKNNHSDFAILLPSTGECLKINPVIAMVTCNYFTIDNMPMGYQAYGLPIYCTGPETELVIKLMHNGTATFKNDDAFHLNVLKVTKFFDFHEDPQRMNHITSPKKANHSLSIDNLDNDEWSW